jgi:hypothetical protein
MENPTSHNEKDAQDSESSRGGRATQEPLKEKGAFLLQFETGDSEDPRNFGVW